MPFTFKHRGTIGAALPEIKGVLGIGKIIAGLLNLLRPLALIFNALALVQKLILFILLLPLLATAAIVQLIMTIIQGLFTALAAFFLLFKNLGINDALSKYNYAGTVGQMPGAFSAYFQNGIPQGNTGPQQNVYAVFFLARGTAAAGGLNDLFGPAPAIPPLPDDPAIPPNEVTGVTLSFAGDTASVSWTNAQGVEETSYNVQLVRADTEVGAVTDEVVNESGTSHSKVFEGVDLEDGVEYKARVERAFGEIKFSEPVKYAKPATSTDPTAPTPPANNPLPVPESANIEFLGRQHLNLAFPFLGAIGGFLAGLQEPLENFQKLITQTIGRVLDRKRGIELMIEQWDKWAADIQKMITRLQHMVDGFLAFSVHVSGFFELGEIYIYRFEGPIGSIGAQINTTLQADGGLRDDPGFDLSVGGTILISESAGSTAVLKFITGG